MRDSRILSAPAALFAYCAVTLTAVTLYRLVVPGEASPLPPYAFSWLLSSVAVDFISFFPAVCMAALTASFGYRAASGEIGRRFSPRFLESMTLPLFSALAASVVYALLFLMVLPYANVSRSDMRAAGALFYEAKGKATEEVVAERWDDAARHFATSDRIWPNSRENQELRDRLEVELSMARSEKEPADIPPGGKLGRESGAASLVPPIGGPVDAVTAIARAEAALRDGRPFDAHRLATIAQRLARPGSPEAAAGKRIASLSWNRVASLEPEAAEKAAFAVYQRKKEGYQALDASDWIRAFYIFEELAERDPGDPEIKEFLTMSEEGARTVSFFIDESASAIGEIDADVLFSLPGKDGGRDVLKAARIRLFSDAAYAETVELLSFDDSGSLRSRVAAPFAKLSPFRVLIGSEDGATSRTVSVTALLMLALDRHDQSKRWEPRWTGIARSAVPPPRAVLEVPYERIQLIARARKGVAALSLNDLISASELLGAFGFVRETFQAEFIRRLSEPFAFLSLAILSIAFGWRLRSLRGVGLPGLPMLILLPLMLHAGVQGFRFAVSVVSTASVVAFPFTSALLAVLAVQAVSLLLSLVFLAGQRG
ncbi:MAG: hypothetical protein A2413_05025 [Treponema sp. RIFOXYC1_FULL_61_9]|nr:MAG: hypothetical protein A2413_05025 [Treponema sp. RIFOXYC1_FULL_61_9]